MIARGSLPETKAGGVQPAANGSAVFVGAPSGGHLYPGIASARELQRRFGVRCSFLCGEGALEQSILAEAGVAHTVIPGLHSGRWRRGLAYHRVRRQLRASSVSAVVSLGGGAGFVTGWAAWSCGVPVFLHEQNRVVGQSQRWLLPVATRTLVSHGDTRLRSGEVSRALRRSMVLTGCPVRAEFQPTALPAGPPRLLVLGGSQGASEVNQAMQTALRQGGAWIKAVHSVVHASGEGKSQGLAEAYREAGVEARVQAYVDVPQELAAAHFVVGRAGATTLAELAAVGRGAALIPYPHHRDRQQFVNAEPLVARGAARIVSAEGTELSDCLTDVFGTEGLLQSMAAAADDPLHRYAAQRVATIVATHLDAVPLGFPDERFAEQVLADAKG